MAYEKLNKVHPTIVAYLLEYGPGYLMDQSSLESQSHLLEINALLSKEPYSFPPGHEDLPTSHALLWDSSALGFVFIAFDPSKAKDANRRLGAPWMRVPINRDALPRRLGGLELRPPVFEDFLAVYRPFFAMSTEELEKPEEQKID